MSRSGTVFKSCKLNQAEKNAAAARDVLMTAPVLIFHLLRFDVVPIDPSNIRNGICKKVYPPTNAAQNAGNLWRAIAPNKMP